VTARRPKVAARLPDAADCLTPSLSAFLPHGPARLHPLAFLSCLHGGKVDLSEQLYGEVFLGYEIFHSRVSLENELHGGGVAASLATSSSMVVGLLHRQAQPDMHSTVGYVVVCDMLQQSILDVTCFMALSIKLGFAVLQ